MIVIIWHIKKNVHLLMQFWKNITFAALYMIVEHIVGIYIYDNIRLPQILLESRTLLSVLL